MRRNKPVFFAFVFIMVCGASMASLVLSSEWKWPRTWPGELAGLRTQSAKIGCANLCQEDLYLIPFRTREAFEEAWPAILKVRSKGSPIILKRSPLPDHSIADMGPGVQIKAPSSPEGLSREFQGASQAPPEYIWLRDRRWLPYAGEPLAVVATNSPLCRVRTDIILVVDDQVVNTNRIRFPKDAPIVDKR